MLDCRGLACPQPVMRAKEAVETDSPETLEVLVDNQAASENVSRFLATRGYESQVKAQGADFLVSARLDPDKAPATDEVDPASYSCAVPAGERKTLVFVNSDTVGRGDNVLGAGLMKNFLATLPEMTPELWRLIFVNGGVKLCCQGSESLDALKGLVDSGVSILVCGTCLNHFGLLEQKQVGETTNMLDVVTSLQMADKVITV